MHRCLCRPCRSSNPPTSRRHPLPPPHFPQGWRTPTPIQKAAVPHLLGGKDVVGLAQTGSGKTGAFAIPVLETLLRAPQPLFCLVLSPTRELAIQIAEQFEALGSGIGLRCVALVGGVDMLAQAVALGRKPHVVVGTPGRVVDHLSNTKGFSLGRLRHLVLDEADRLLNLDFEAEIDQILRVIPRDRHTQLFSATMTSKVQKLQRACLRDPVRVEVAAHNHQTADGLRQQYLFVPARHKDVYLAFLLSEMAGSTAMLFVRTCDGARRLALALRNLGIGAVPIHGQMGQPKRLAALNKFKAGEREVLVATDVASRGLDVPSVDLVVNVDVPANPKDYVHRVGRTARAGRSGRAITLVTQYDVETFQRIEELIQCKLEAYPADEAAVMLLLDRVGEANRLATLVMKEKDAASKVRAGKRGRGSGGDDDDAAGRLGLGGDARRGKRR